MEDKRLNVILVLILIMQVVNFVTNLLLRYFK